jgi:hypothetical protein
MAQREPTASRTIGARIAPNGYTENDERCAFPVLLTLCLLFRWNEDDLEGVIYLESPLNELDPYIAFLEAFTGLHQHDSAS